MVTLADPLTFLQLAAAMYPNQTTAKMTFARTAVWVALVASTAVESVRAQVSAHSNCDVVVRLISQVVIVECDCPPSLSTLLVL
jgi:hypothetical protein